MDALSLLEHGAAAAEDILRDVYRVEVGKRLDPLDDADFIKLTERLARSLRRSAKKTDDRALDLAAAKLAIDWATATPQVAELAIAEAAQAYKDEDEKLGPEIAALLALAAVKIQADTRKALVETQSLDVSPALTERDHSAGKWLVGATLMFTADATLRRADRFTAKATELARAGLAAGLPADEMTAQISDAIVLLVRQPAYWDVVANSFEVRARSFAQVYAYDDASVAKYRWVSVPDKRRCVVCEFMEGRTFSVRQQARRIEDLAQLDNLDDIRNAMPAIQVVNDNHGNEALYYQRHGNMHLVAAVDHQNDRDGFHHELADDALARAGLAFPPIHALCRCILEAVG